MWNLYKNDKFLNPLEFSNGKNQESVVEEILKKIKDGKKIIFIRGVCGTGKSAIALNIAKELGKTSIVVPGKALQAQYKRDYEKDKYVLGKNKEKLKINVITGRKNHKCKFLEDNKTLIPKLRREIDSKLHDIFEGRREEAIEEFKRDDSADNDNLPCKIEIKEKNWQKIKEYLAKNKHVNTKTFDELKDVKRISVASYCPYWSPAISSEYESKSPILKNADKKEYVGLKGKKFTFYERKKGCGFYHQFNYFIESDVIVFNSLKYKLESAMDRKPATAVEIIDECDEFLDSFSDQRNLNLNRLQNALIYTVSENEKTSDVLSEISELVSQIQKNMRIKNSADSGEVIPLKATGIYDILNVLLKNEEFLEEIDEESYLFNVKETAKMFKDFFDESYVSVSKQEKNLIFGIVTINLAKKFKEMVDKNEVFVLMSGTVHSEKVLKEVFGLDKFVVIDAETKNQGEIKIKKTGKEKDFKYENFSNGKFSRQDYLEALDACVMSAQKPALVHVNSFSDLPTKREIVEFELKNLIEREKLKDLQEQDKNNEAVKDFKEGKIDTLFSTKVSRGIDFPGGECNAIIFTKYPNPNVKDAFWKILYKTRPQHYWDFYKDKARRELLQRLYRGLRFEDDKVEVWSPDLRVLEFFEKLEG